MSHQRKQKIQAEHHPDELIFIQSRAEINLAIVQEYSEMMANGIIFDPVEGLQDENGDIYIFDGSHRGEAAKKAGTTLLVTIRPGDRTEAEWLALAANQKHGLRRSNADKQRVVHRALLHPYGVNLSNSELAHHCGVSDKTVARIRRELELSSEIPKIEKRIVRRNGVVYKQNTRNIGTVESQKRVFASDAHKPSALRSNSNAHEPNHIRAVDKTDQLFESPGPVTQPSNVKSANHQAQPQQFECPRCGLEKIVGVNGSRRWCLNCGAEWPTAAEFMAEVKATGHQNIQVPSREELRERFLDILARLEEQDVQLSRIDVWLNELENRLVMPQNNNPADETDNQITEAMSIMEYA